MKKVIVNFLIKISIAIIFSIAAGILYNIGMYYLMFGCGYMAYMFGDLLEI